MPNLLKLFRHGGAGSGNWGHAGRPGEVGGSMPRGFTALSIGKNKYSKRRRSADLEYFGVNVVEKHEKAVEKEHEEFWELRKKKQEESERRWRENNYSGKKDPNPLEDFQPEPKSYSLDKSAGFPKGHPLADPKTRSAVVRVAIEQLSYSNMVGYGGALKKTAQGKKEDELYKHFQNLLGRDGITLEDVLQATYAETQGYLKSIGAPDRIPLYHGSTSFRTSREQKFDIGTSFSGFSSWSGNEQNASQFGSHTLFSMVPSERILVIPAQVPRQMVGVPSFVGGGRDEKEYIVLSDDFFENIR